MLRSARPVILLGHGLRSAGAADLAPALLKLGVPVLTSWQAKDMLDNGHPMYFGSPGIYGQRCANAVLHHADEVLAIGNRLAIWNVGHAGIRPDQRLQMVDIDGAEVRKFKHAEWINQDTAYFIWRLPHMSAEDRERTAAWRAQCYGWRARWPLHEPEAGTHDDANGYINSYRFAHALQPHLAPDEVIVTEMGAALMAAHQVLCIRPPQRLMTSGGLGEMGCGLPAAIGASFARGRWPVLCLSTDGGMMMNLQELQTIVHHRLPVRIIVFNNSGYGMLKHTQDGAGMVRSGVDAASGVSFPNFRHVAGAFGITASEVRTWEDFERIIPSFMARRDAGPELVDFIMDPRQKYLPKLGYEMVDGKQVYDRFDDMAPKQKEELISG